MLVTACGDPHVLNGYRSPMGVNGMRQRAHAGVDFKGSVGDAVIAAAPGVVQSVIDDAGAGLSVMIRHGDDRYTSYIHLSESEVDVGDRVVRGEQIAKVGKSGWGSGGVPHVHLALCTYPCTVGSSDGNFDGVLDPIANGAGCFDPRRTYEQTTLTYPVVCGGTMGVPVSTERRATTRFTAYDEAPPPDEPPRRW